MFVGWVNNCSAMAVLYIVHALVLQVQQDNFSVEKLFAFNNAHDDHDDYRDEFIEAR